MTRRRGVALLDVLVGALMLGVGLAVLMSLSSQSLQGELTAQRRITATWLADEALAMVLARGPHNYQMNEPMEGYFDPPYDMFTWSLEMNQQGDWQPWVVRSIVTWTDLRGPMSVEIDTLIAPRQGEDDVPEDWKPIEPLDREARTWGDEETTTATTETPG